MSNPPSTSLEPVWTVHADGSPPDAAVEALARTLLCIVDEDPMESNHLTAAADDDTD